MKLKKMFILFGMFSLSLSGPAQLLWKISGNGLEKPSYLSGTHHIAPLSIRDSLTGFHEAFDNCTQLYDELLLEADTFPETKASSNYCAVTDLRLALFGKSNWQYRAYCKFGDV